MSLKRCQICGDEREEKFISLYQFNKRSFNNSPRSVQHCNDRSDCLAGAIELERNSKL